jgi:hypothetical protein
VDRFEEAQRRLSYAAAVALLAPHGDHGIDAR